jgi:hypothetical protein
VRASVVLYKFVVGKDPTVEQLSKVGLKLYFLEFHIIGEQCL